MNTKKLLKTVPHYDRFFTLAELDKRAFDVAKRYNFDIKTVGKSFEGRPLYLIKAGDGKKCAFLWGFPHPNEPIGSLTIDCLIHYFGEHKDELKKSGYTWYFMYTADPDGTILNEAWFKGKLTLRKYFLHFYRPPANRMIDWTFPITYKNFAWKKPLYETKILMNILHEIKPDIMYPLHNSGFGGAYFFSTKKFDDTYYTSIITYTKKLGIPLHMGAPEVDFMVAIKKPFYFDFGFKEYYDREVKLGKKPHEILQHGDNSTHYLLRINPHATVIKGEVPYFYDKKIIDESPSQKTRRNAWLQIIKESDSNIEFYKKLIPELLNTLRKPDPYWYIVKDIERQCKHGNKELKKHIKTSSDYDSKLNQSELFDLTVIYTFYRGLLFGQLRRAAIKAGAKKTTIQVIEKKIDTYQRFVEKHSDWEVFPIQKLVQLQLLVLFETMNALKRKKGN